MRGGKVAVGNGVSVGKGVGVIMPAIAVLTAWVMTMFMSGVGADDAGWHAVKTMASRPRTCIERSRSAKKKRESGNMGEYFTNNHLERWRVRELLITIALDKSLRHLAANVITELLGWGFEEIG